MHATRRKCFQLGYVKPHRMCGLFEASVVFPHSWLRGVVMASCSQQRDHQSAGRRTLPLPAGPAG